MLVDRVQTTQLEILNEVARIATLDLELRPMLQRITDALASKFDWEFVALVTIDRERGAFVCEAVTSIARDGSPRRLHAAARQRRGRAGRGDRRAGAHRRRAARIRTTSRRCPARARRSACRSAITARSWPCSISRARAWPRFTDSSRCSPASPIRSPARLPAAQLYAELKQVTAQLEQKTRALEDANAAPRPRHRDAASHLHAGRTDGARQPPAFRRHARAGMAARGTQRHAAVAADRSTSISSNPSTTSTDIRPATTSCAASRRSCAIPSIAPPISSRVTAARSSSCCFPRPTQSTRGDRGAAARKHRGARRRHRQPRRGDAGAITRWQPRRARETRRRSAVRGEESGTESRGVALGVRCPQPPLSKAVTAVTAAAAATA